MAPEALVVGCHEAGDNRDLVRRLVACQQRLFLLFGRWRELSPTRMAFYPDLGKEVAFATTMEDQFGLSLRLFHLNRIRHYIRGGAAVRALNQQERSLSRILDPILTRRERHLPRCELKWNTREQWLLRPGDLGCCQEGQRQEACNSAKRVLHGILLLANFSAVPALPFSEECARVRGITA